MTARATTPARNERYEVRWRKRADGWEGPGRLLCFEGAEAEARRRREKWAATADVLDCFVIDRKTGRRFY